MQDVKKETSLINLKSGLASSLSPTTDTFTLAHISDLHLTSLKHTAFSQLLNKRMLGYFSWWRNRRRVHRSDIVEALLEDLKRSSPDHIAVTGDLTHLGLPGEFAEAEEWLTRLGTTEEVTVIPGNHEAYTGGEWSKQLAAWAPYLDSDNRLSGSGKTGFFPSLRVRGPFALIGLCSARPSLPFLAVGSLDDKQLQKLGELLVKTGEAGLVRVILVHHPPILGTTTWRKRLVNSSAFADVIAGCGAELILHGHTHTPTFTELQTPDCKVPVIGAPSASELNPHKERCAEYNLYEYKRASEGRELKMSVRRYAQSSGRFDADREVILRLPHP